MGDLKRLAGGWIAGRPVLAGDGATRVDAAPLDAFAWPDEDLRRIVGT
ncbi:MAG: hypothetical protein RIB67_11485 [Miltoncostaeaceae bacterium]